MIPHSSSALLKQDLGLDIDGELKAAMQGWLDNMRDPEGSKKYGDQIREMLFAYNGNELLDKIDGLSSYFTKRSYWIFVGDGSAYDISFGGIDHVLASGEEAQAGGAW